MRIGIVGATGYGGAELLRLLNNHPEAKNIQLYTSTKEGVHIEESYPHVATIYDTSLKPFNPEVVGEDSDLVFMATPPGVSAQHTQEIASHGTQVIDLSGDLRITDPTIYETWYKRPAAQIETINQAVYGLSEWNREAIQSARIISNPGCYPTAALLGLAPLIHNDAIQQHSIIIDAKTGTSGAGRSATMMTHFSEMNENFKIYQVNTHKHTPEIEQQLHQWNNESGAITFQPHLVPMIRGIMATMYVQLKKPLTSEQLFSLYHQAYDGKPFVRIRKENNYPATKEVYGSNYCDIGLSYDERTGRVTVVSVIDNMVKGAAGQAIQNMNLMNGWDESMGLNLVPVYP
ncbi:N-acetyl-gamma-glutamyl-phosphate reductase [Alkalicoccobacillus murimartini]|uniref:N-acetyl-gamma-glutamyl-phosphate reductase n=1 Tax=Alkalicoccobacillus murimartini TaxID=171685 RepID=A0ABT9YJ90_9BACI|nr:N-acetyl-gamma-glutamyl-phosphate reductase [Alkalicoccobacillus murimartini]MDQ0207937.1 N-acetyl-gamma-glutamyl-phosphate reductase [Alkalicoccobacillus murimartini]